MSTSGEKMVQKAATPNYAYGANFGKVKRLYPTTDKTYFTFTNGKTEMNPKDGYYYVPSTHKNFSAMMNLLYLAAEQKWTLYARTQEKLDSNGHAEVIYFIVDF